MDGRVHNIRIHILIIIMNIMIIEQVIVNHHHTSRCCAAVDSAQSVHTYRASRTKQAVIGVGQQLVNDHFEPAVFGGSRPALGEEEPFCSDCRHSADVIKRNTLDISNPAKNKIEVSAA